MTHYIYNGNNVSIAPEGALDIRNKLEPVNYVVKFDEMTNQYSLEKTEMFTLPKKLYGDISFKAERILNTFKDRSKSTGVLLVGEKGSGKSQLAKLCCINSNLPVLLINENFYGSTFNQFITSITEPVIIFFDEFEKVYKKEHQEHLLSLLDGNVTSNTLFIFTCNNEHTLDVNMINRPGRVFYNIKYTGLDESFIIDYCKDIAEHLTDKIILVSKICTNFNFDMLKALVEECLRYSIEPVDALDMLNIKPDNLDTTFNVSMESSVHKLIRWDLTVRGNVYKTINVECVKEDLTQDDKESHWINLYLTPSMFTKETSLAKEIFVYEVDGIKVTLTPKVLDTFSFKSLMV